jgi:hypothetical protein
MVPLCCRPPEPARHFVYGEEWYVNRIGHIAAIIGECKNPMDSAG